MKTASLLSVLMLSASFAAASHITVSVAKDPIVTSTAGDGLVYVVFEGERPTVTVSVNIYEIPERPSSANGLGELRKVDSATWWNSLTWSLFESRTGTSVSVPREDIVVVGATTEPVSSTYGIRHAGVFRLPNLPVGDYRLSVSLASITGSDSFVVRNGTESAFIRDRFLEKRASRTMSWVEYKSIQQERLALSPARADILLELGKRALDAGTIDEANAYFDRAIDVMTANQKAYAKRATTISAAETEQRLRKSISRLRALQAELPHYFAHRADLMVVEAPTDGEMRFVVKERRTGRVTRVIGE